MKRFFFLLLFLNLSWLCASEKKNLVAPPSNLPVQVKTSFYLFSLNGIKESSQTFRATFYVRLKWLDERLAFTTQEGEPSKRIYVGQTAVENQFKNIWSPQLEIENATHLQITNHTLNIYNDGTVEYLMGISATLHSSLDFELYPFDTQKLFIKINSFVWNSKQMELVPDRHQIALIDPTLKEYNDFHIEQISDKYLSMHQVSAPGKGSYSNLIITIQLKRNPSYAIHQFILPLILLFGITCTAFFLEESDLASRLYLITATILAFVATKYTIRSTMPRLGYMTMLDTIFFLSYVFGAIAVLISVIENFIERYRTPLHHTADRFLWWMLPLVFVGVCLLVFFMEKYL